MSETFPTPPPGIGGGLAAAAERCLHRLPEHLLRAMATGLRENADDLTTGALFRGRYSGGCAVGVTLRELDPDAFRFGRVEFWLWYRWRRGLEPDLARRFPQLQQLQQVFDDAVGEVKQAGQDPQPTRSVGLWLTLTAETELRVRELPARRSGLLANAQTRWNRRRPHQPLDGKLRAGISEHHPADLETSSCS
ncbi:MAG TPA: hypothetical protein VGF70_09740 [Solirubrobacteraceae bacterium]